MAHSSSYQEFKAGGYVAYFSLEGARSAAGKAGSDSDTGARCRGLVFVGWRACGVVTLEKGQPVLNCSA